MHSSNKTHNIYFQTTISESRNNYPRTLAKFVGANGIAMHFIRDSLLAIAYYLMVLIKQFLVTDVFPSLWKMKEMVITILHVSS